MEIGHNVMHGQYDWMNDPDAVAARASSGTRPAPATSGATRTTTCTTPTPTSSARTATSATASCACPRTSRGTRTTWATRSTRALLAAFFQYGVALHDLELERITAGEVEPGRQARHAPRDLAQGPPADAQGLRPLPGARRAIGAAHARRQRDRQPDPQPVVVHDHLLRPLPRRHAGVHRGGDRGRDPRPVVLPPAARLGQPRAAASCSTSCPATSATRSSTTCSPTSRRTATRRSPPRCARSASATASRTTRARCTSSSAASSARSSGWPAWIVSAVSLRSSQAALAA